MTAISAIGMQLPAGEVSSSAARASRRSRTQAVNVIPRRRSSAKALVREM